MERKGQKEIAELGSDGELKIADFSCLDHKKIIEAQKKTLEEHQRKMAEKMQPHIKRLIEVGNKLQNGLFYVIGNGKETSLLSQSPFYESDGKYVTASNILICSRGFYLLSEQTRGKDNSGSNYQAHELGNRRAGILLVCSLDKSDFPLTHNFFREIDDVTVKWLKTSDGDTNMVTISNNFDVGGVFFEGNGYGRHFRALGLEEAGSLINELITRRLTIQETEMANRNIEIKHAEDIMDAVSGSLELQEIPENKKTKASVFGRLSRILPKKKKS